MKTIMTVTGPLDPISIKFDGIAIDKGKPAKAIGEIIIDVIFRTFSIVVEPDPSDPKSKDVVEEARLRMLEMHHLGKHGLVKLVDM